MKHDMRCEECKNTTKYDQFACNCLCINCGPCEHDCEHKIKQTCQGYGNKLDEGL